MWFDVDVYDDNAIKKESVVNWYPLSIQYRHEAVNMINLSNVTMEDKLLDVGYAGGGASDTALTYSTNYFGQRSLENIKADN